MARVLVVDDSEDMQDTYELLLDGEGYEVFKASDGVAGLHAVCAERPDIVLLDMMMPDCDGLQFLQRLPIECPAPLPRVIAISGFEPYREEALRRGAAAFLRKPVDVDVLFGAVRAVEAERPVPAAVEVHNEEDVAVSRRRADELRSEIVGQLPGPAVDAIRTRLRALAGWLQRYYGFGATFVQLLRGNELRVEAARGGSPPWVEGHHYARQLAWCSDVIDAGSTVVLSDPLDHTLSYFSQHPEVAAGFHFYAGVPLTTRSGAVIGTLCLCDVESHIVHAEDMHLLEALGLHVAHGLEEVAAGVDVDDFVVDDEGVFGSELLPLFVQVATQRAARAGGVVGIAIVRVVDPHQSEAAARAAYVDGRGAGLVVVWRDDDELALVQVGRDRDAHRNLRAALDACRSATAVRSIGTAWCRMAPGSVEAADSELSAQLINMASEAHDHPTAPQAPSLVGAHAA
jgi:CheY-like chemotaxis protein